MYIEPNTTIKLLSDVPLTKNYDDTIYFNSAIEQLGYFNSKVVRTFEKNTYQRVSKGKCRLQVNASQIYACNYMMFQNSAYDRFKWFYAFIDNVEYINDVTSEITFTIDVMQTWFFDYTLEQSYVVREHSVTDNIGDNIIPENLDIGEVVTSDNYSSNAEDINAYGQNAIVIARSSNIIQNEGSVDIQPLSGQMVGGIYTGVHFKAFPVVVQPEVAIAQANLILDIMTKYNQSDSIVSIFMFPNVYVPDAFKIQGEPIALKFDTVSRTTEIRKDFTDLDGYTPKNKKLFTYPYNFLYVYSSQGNDRTMSYEFFNGDTCKFQCMSQFSCTPELLLVPYGYKQHGGIPTDGRNIDESLIINDFPQCAYNIDGYKVWLAQNSVPMMTKIVQMGTGSIGSAMAGSVSGTASRVGTGVAGMIGDMVQASLLPTKTKNISNGNTLMSNGICGFFFARKTVNKQIAKRIDDYFSMYGYRTDELKVPNRNVRPHWTYTQTENCNLFGHAPADDLTTIKNIYNKGITFWKNGDEVGNYSLNNSV